MSDITTETPIDQLTPDQFREMREAANAHRASQAELEATRRELAFTRAGVNTTSPLGQIMLGAYKGDLTEDAIKAWVSELNVPITPTAELPPETTPAPTTAFSPQEQQAVEATRSLFTGSTAPVMPTGPADPHTAGLDAYRKAREQGMAPHDAGAAYLDQLLKAVAANPNDRRVVWNGFTQEEIEQGRIPWQ
jgi:hypothetical protein